jgi:hypothetical protein
MTVPKKDAGSGPSASGAAPPAPKSKSKGKGKANIVELAERQAPPPGGGGKSGGGKGNDLSPEQQAKINDFKNKIKDFQTCSCKGKATTELLSCAAKSCTDADALNTLTTLLNKGCGSVEGFKPLTAPGGGPSAARMMT